MSAPDSPQASSSELRYRTGLLEALVPRLVLEVPRVELATLPTPVVSYPDLASAFGLAELLVKRDDMTSPLYGGTKVRGLEFFLGHALSRGSRCVLTMGSAGSNHAIATAIFSKEIGIATRAVLFPHPDRSYADRNVERLESLGADIRRPGWLGLIAALLRARASVSGTRPLWIAPGGSSALGVLGAAEGALEVVEAARIGAIKLPEDVVVAAGSCGTAAGLALGFALADAPVRVIAVRVVTRMVASRAKILRLTSAGEDALRRSGMSRAVRIGEVEMVQTEAGAGYARPTTGALKAMTIAHQAGIRAETTYTGKAWSHALSGAFRGRRTLFWNTFGG